MRNFGYGFTLDEICNKAAALYSCQLAAVKQARSYTKSKAKLFFSQLICTQNSGHMKN